jgi:hypothetical protein
MESWLRLAINYQEKESRAPLPALPPDDAPSYSERGEAELGASGEFDARRRTDSSIR